MSISEQGWAAMQVYDHVNASSHRAKIDSQHYALKLMAKHLYEVHGFGVRKIGKMIGLKYKIVKNILSDSD